MADGRGSRSRCASRVLRRQLLTVPLESAGVARPEHAILQGRVQVNGRLITSKWERVDLMRDAIKLDGHPLAVRFCRYVLFNKPYDVMSHFTDQHDRATVADYVDLPDIYAAGRLDRDSEGLLLLTDDGWLNHRLTTPRYGHPRTYLAQVERVPSEEALQSLREGVTIKKYRTRPAQVMLLAEPPNLPPRPVPIRFRKNVPTAWLRIVLTEGRTRQVRRMTAAVGYPTLRLVRVAIGSLTLEGLAPGEWREVNEEELDRLRREIGR